MIDLSDIALDPDFAQMFTVFRSSGSWLAGRWVENAPAQIPMLGLAWMASERDLRQVPEGDRAEGAMMFVATQPLYITRAEVTIETFVIDSDTGGIVIDQSSGAPIIALEDITGTSDQILWEGELYRIQKIFPFQKQGFYQAYAFRTRGN